MTFKASLLISADANQAVAELDKLGGATGKAGAQATRLGRQGKVAARGTERLGSAADRADTELRGLAAAQQLATANTRNLGRTNQAAAANVGNLTAQFNDIGMMLMAGQNPLQMAVQQGTQITQVIGPMGAAGAVRALGAGLMSMLNPVSLITIGSIAAGAAMVNWLRNSGEAARTLEEILSDLSAGVDAYAKSAQGARGSTEELAEMFGAAGSAAQGMLVNIAAMQRVEAIETMRDAVAGLVEEFGGFEDTPQMVFGGVALGMTGMPMTEIQVSLANLKSEFSLTTQEADALTWALAAMNEAATPDQAIAGAIEFSDVLLAIFGTASEIPKPLRQAAIAAAELAAQAGKILTEDEAARRARNQGWAEYYASRQRGAEFLAKARARELTELAAMHDLHARTRLAGARQEQAARQMLHSLQAENELQAAIIAHGEDSVEVTALRARAERQVLEKMLATWDVAESLKDEMRAAFEHSQDLAGLDMASGVAAAADAAARMADELVRALAGVREMSDRGAFALEDARIRAAHGDDPIEAARQLGMARMMRQQALLRDGADRTQLTWLDAQAVVFGNQQAEIARLNQQRRGGAGGGAPQERDPVAELVQSLRDELAILREINPVMAEMLRHREVLAGATEAERQAVRALIEARLEEEDMLARSGLFTDTAFDALDGLIRRGESFGDVMAGVGDMIERAVLQAILLGEGPLAGLFGMGAQGGAQAGGTGGVLGMLAGVLIPGQIPDKAAGGLISGPGSGTSDSVPIMASSGEFVMTAAATRRHRHLLEAINAGAIPRLASGGPVLPARASTEITRPSGRSEQGGAVTNVFKERLINASA